MNDTIMVNQTTKNRVWIFYLSSFLNALSSGVVGPLLIVYLLTLNLSTAQVGLLLAIERGATIITEFPTGVFADKYGRRKSLLISFGLLALILTAWFFTKSYLVFIILSFCWGLAYTFQSGAKESFVIDSLNLANDDTSRNKVFSRLAAAGNFGLVIGGLIAAGLTLVSLRSIWLAAAVANGFLFLLFLTATHEIPNSSDTKINRQGTLKGFISSSLQSLRSISASRTISRLMGITIIVGLVMAIYGFSYPILFKTLGLPLYYFGLLGSVAAILGITGALLGEKIVKRAGYRTSLTYLTFILIILFSIFGFTETLGVTILLFATIELTLHGWFPIYNSFLNKFIPNGLRSSLLSINSTLSLLALAGGELMAGALVMIVSPAQLIAWGGILLVIILLLLRNINHSTTTNNTPKATR